MNDLIAYEDMYEEAWSRLQAAADDRSHPLRLQAFATSCDQGRADARLLVMRGASRKESRAWYHTDCRSLKVQQIIEDPYSCVVAYDAGDGVQLRMKGTADIHRDDALADRHWEQVEVHVRHAYGFTETPGQPIPERDPRMRHQLLRRSASDLEESRRNFAVIELHIDCIEWLQVSDLGDRRAVMRRDQWIVVPLVP